MILPPLSEQALSCAREQQFPEAETLYRRLLASEPGNAESWFMLGMVRSNRQDMSQAIHYVQKAIALDPGVARYHYNLGVLSMTCNRPEEAKTCFIKALRLDNAYVAASFNLGVLYQEQQCYEEAIAWYKRTITIHSHHTGAHNNLGAVYLQLGYYGEAIAAYRGLLAISPDDAGALNNLAVVFKEINKLDVATSLLAKASLLPSSPSYIYSNLLFNLHYDPAQTNDSLFAAHREWDRRYGVPDAVLAYSNRNPEKILHIGYVSGDFKSHPVGFFLLSTLAAHNRDQVKIHCYSSTQAPDSATEQIKHYTDCWREIGTMEDEQAARLIREDAIDILVDLSGHTADNRLPLFARKPAPIQVAWLGYFNTTGMKAMDYFISDPVHTPEGYEQWFSEQVVRLPDCYMCYTPPAGAPSPAMPPMVEKGIVTFGCFNALVKINEEVIVLWADILRRVPGSRLILKAKALGHIIMREWCLTHFTNHGIPRERIDLRGWSDHRAMLAEYREVDIALDPFPFSGGLTSCETLWMGIPVITLAGEWVVSRQTASYLTQAGLSELITTSKAAYSNMAVALATNQDKLISLRAGLRERVAASPLCDGKRFAANLEAAYRTMWTNKLK